KGRATVAIDAGFAPLIAHKGYQVFVTANGPCNGLYVSRRGPTSFEVREQGGGERDAPLSYPIVGRRKGVEAKRLAKVDMPPMLHPASSRKGRPTPPELRRPPRRVVAN